MLPFAVVAAVGIAAIFMQHRVVHHFPNAAAHQIIEAVDFLPVILCRAGANTHGMGIFAQEIGPVVQLLLLALMLADFSHIFHAGVHLAAHIVGDALAVDDAFVMHRDGGVGFQPGIHGIGVVIAAGLVAQAPQNDAGPVFIPVVQMLNPFHIPGQPGFVRGNAVRGGRELVGEGAVGFQIVFVYDIDAVFVAQLDEQRIRGIVGGADGVDVVAFAKQNIPLNFVRGQAVAAGGAGIVVIDAPQLQLLAVQGKDIALNLYILKAHALPDNGVAKLDVKIVQRRLFRVPLLHIQMIKTGGCMAVF